MKQISFLFFLSFFLYSLSYASTSKLTNKEALASESSTYSIFNVSKKGRLLTGTGSDICAAPLLILDEIPIADGSYSASLAISSKGQIPANGNVTFKAGTSVFLLPGFHAVAQGEFAAIIEDCVESLNTPTTSTIIEENSNQNVLTNPLLKKQNLSIYPNPFNYIATVDFQLFEEQKVHLAIYSATQQLVKVLEPDKTMSKGNYKYEFSGEHLIGGMYFVVLTTEQTRLTKKLILVK